MKGNFKASLAAVLKHEGGWSDHPSDPGGATMKGITIGRYRQYHPNATKEQLRAISDAEVEAIYKADYWDKIKADDLPIGVDYSTFDAAVNSGPAQGVKWLQRALGVKDDGRIGAATISAARASDAKTVIVSANAKRLAMLRGLKTFNVFGAGWTRRVREVEALALQMAGQKPEAVSVAVVTPVASVSSGAAAAAAASQAGIPPAGQIVIGLAVLVLVFWLIMRGRK